MLSLLPSYYMTTVDTIKNGSSTSVLVLKSTLSSFSGAFQLLVLVSKSNHIGFEDKHKCFNYLKLS